MDIKYELKKLRAERAAINKKIADVRKSCAHEDRQYYSEKLDWCPTCWTHLPKISKVPPQ